jgi:excisionase family DNA binding protein
MTITEAADYVGVIPNTLRNWEKDKKISTYRNPYNKYRLYKKEDLDKLLKKVTRPTKEKKVMKWKNSDEAVPNFSGYYFILNHCDDKDILYYDSEFAQWLDREQEERKCPKCAPFKWLDMEEK